MHLNNELEFLVRIFIENGYQEKVLRKLMKEVGDKINGAPDVDESSSEETLPTITLPWIPTVSPKLRKVYRKAGYKVAFKANPNLQTILTRKNKAKLPPNSYPGVYEIECGCERPPYIGQTKKKIESRFHQHQDYVAKEQWDKSGAAKHARVCPKGTEFKGIRTVKPINNQFDREVREALEIQKNNSGPRQGGPNLDDGRYVKTTFWLPMMSSIRRDEEARRNGRMTSNDQETNAEHDS